VNKIRPALPSDASSMLETYAPFILNTTVSFETEVPSIEDFTQRVMTNQESWPWLVYESDKVIAGYAYASKHRERAAYQWCVETSVYISDRFQQKGIATKLYQALFHILKFQGCRNVYAGITLPNDKSVRFHEKMGFKKIADYTNIGYKFNHWNTVRWYALQLNNYTDPPAPFKKWKQMGLKDREAIMKEIELNEN
jgi:L-amino acid N-acyltransferase YncA